MRPPSEPILKSLHGKPVSHTNITSTSAPRSTFASAVLVPYELVPGENPVPGAGPIEAAGGPPLTELQVLNGSATAVWEVLSTNPAEMESLSFGVWQQFT